MALQLKPKHQVTCVCIRLETKKSNAFILCWYFFSCETGKTRHFFGGGSKGLAFFFFFFVHKYSLPAKISELLLALIAAKRGWDWSRWKDDHRDPFTNTGMGFCGSGCHLDQQNPDRLSCGLESPMPERTREITSFRS